MYTHIHTHTHTHTSLNPKSHIYIICASDRPGALFEMRTVEHKALSSVSVPVACCHVEG